MIKVCKMQLIISTVNRLTGCFIISYKSVFPTSTQQFLYKEHKTIVAMSSKYSFDADKAVQISQAEFLLKGHNLNFDVKTAKSPYKSGHHIFFMKGFLMFKLSENFNIALLSMHTQHQLFVLKF